MMTRGGAWLFASAFFSAGLAILAVACNWIPVDPATIHAPRWVVAVGGVAFLAGGFVPMTTRLGPNAWQSQLVGAVVVMALAAVFNWIAFGPGERQFTSTVSIGGSLVRQHGANETSGRIVFGIAAVLIDLFLVFVAVRWARGRRRSNL
jgi:hypothetical protein